MNELLLSSEDISYILDSVDETEYDDISELIHSDPTGECFIAVEDYDYILEHYGMPRRSGRYPWGSGEDPYQRTGDLLGRIETLKKNGWTETPENIRKEFGITTTEYRKQYSLATNERRALDVARAKSLKEDGLGATEIARIMSKDKGTNVNESTVRSWLNAESEAKMNKAKATAEILKKTIDEKGMIDVGKGVEIELGVSREKLDQALKILAEEGYPTYGGRMDQPTNPGKKTTLKVIGPPGTEHKDIFNLDEVHSMQEYASRDGGETFVKFQYPKSMDSSRLMIRYAEDGGVNKDGLVEIRRGVDDLSLGNDHYSQVRILVDGSHYIKGMAAYSDGKDMPAGVDVIFNTNKTKNVSKMDVLKEIKSDPDNPFGSTISPKGQSEYIDKNGKKQLSLINKRAAQGDWSEWKDALPSQFLSKQSKYLAEKQLKLALDDKKAEYNAIMELINPTIKKKLLKDFAESCDSQAVHLQAAALPGQKYHVIIPINTLKDNEIFAPNYPNGSQVALVRYPHGGTFEIPILTVNNKNKLAKDIIGTDSHDGVGVTKAVADRLSGADFDGDTVMCIPTNRNGIKIASRPLLKGLEGFEGKDTYGGEKKIDKDGKEHWYRNEKEYAIMSKANTQKQMGVISNLITDMTIQGAKDDELAAAVRHSMVVIDAEKHHLDYKASERDNNISALKKEYQPDGGASTLISRAKGETSIDRRQGSPHTNVKGSKWYDPSRPEGALVYAKADNLEYTTAKINRRGNLEPNATLRISEKGRKYIQIDGEKNWTPLSGDTKLPSGSRVNATAVVNRRSQKITQMEKTDDARTLISKTESPIEILYANYANSLKSMANTARLDVESAGKVAYSPAANKKYKEQVDSLDRKLKISEVNAPREREALRRANTEIAAKKQSNPGMTKEDVKKLSQQAVTKYRSEVDTTKGSERSVKIEPKEWEAIQAGAISESKLIRILNHSDKDTLKQLAMPRATTQLSNAEVSRIKALAASNYTLEEIARKMGKSTSTINKYLKGEN